MAIIDGRKIRNDILEDVKKEVAKLSFQPVFCDVLVGDDPVSAQYVRMKAKTAESVGIKFHSADFPATITTEALIDEIKKINTIQDICGIIVQLPLPPHLDKRAILDAIDSHLDVDCLGTAASSAFYADTSVLGFPTALACMAILDTLHLDLSDKKIVVLGQGELVGRPVTHLFGRRNLQVDSVRRGTENKEVLIKNADVIISGTGQGKFITGDMVKAGVVIIDAGTSESTGGVVGDADLASLENVVSYISPVPGGVGPVTVAILLRNVLTVAQGISK